MQKWCSCLKLILYNHINTADGIGLEKNERSTGLATRNVHHKHHNAVIRGPFNRYKSKAHFPVTVHGILTSRIDMQCQKTSERAGTQSDLQSVGFYRQNFGLFDQLRRHRITFLSLSLSLPDCFSIKYFPHIVQLYHQFLLLHLQRTCVVCFIR